jgi:hypothetical protein
MGSYQYKVIQVKYKLDYYNGVVDSINKLELLVNKACEFTSWEPIGGINVINTTDKYNILTQSLRMENQFVTTSEIEEDEWIDEVDDI